MAACLASSNVARPNMPNACFNGTYAKTSVQHAVVSTRRGSSFIGKFHSSSGSVQALSAAKRTNVVFKVKREFAAHASASTPQYQGTRNATADLEALVAALRQGDPVCILDAADREGETDLFFPAIDTHATSLRQLRTQAGGELYIAVGHEVASAFGLPFVGEALDSASAKFPVLSGMSKSAGGMCQGTCSVGLSLDHRSTHTGAPDDERSFTCRRLAEMVKVALEQPHEVQTNAEALGKEFHIPGHIFLCQESTVGLAARRGHSELAVAAARAAGVVPVMVGCVMLNNEGDEFGALSPAAAQQWARANGVPFIDGKDMAEALGFPREL